MHVLDGYGSNDIAFPVFLTVTVRFLILDNFKVQEIGVPGSDYQHFRISALETIPIQAALCYTVPQHFFLSMYTLK